MTRTNERDVHVKVPTDDLKESAGVIQEPNRQRETIKGNLQPSSQRKIELGDGKQATVHGTLFVDPEYEIPVSSTYDRSNSSIVIMPDGRELMPVKVSDFRHGRNPHIEYRLVSLDE